MRLTGFLRKVKKMKISRAKLDVALARACMNVSDLSRKGIGRSAIERAVASSGRGVTPKTAGKIAQALSVDVTDLLEAGGTSWIPTTRDIAGYSGTGPNAGIFVAADDALDFASERCGIRFEDTGAPDFDEFLEMFEEWFFSSWVKEVATDDQRTA